MSISTPPPADKEPTLADLKAIATAAQQRAEAAESAAQAATEAAAGAQQEARNRGLELPDAVLDQIAVAAGNATVAALEQRGLITTDTADPPADPTADPPAADPTADPPAADPPEDEGPAREKTFAERFLGI